MDIDSIPIGRDFREQIRTALSKADVVVAVVGSSWLGVRRGGHARIDDESDPVRVEIEMALERGIPIIPVLVGDTKMPEPSKLPDGMKAFSFINAATVATGRDFNVHMERLVRSVDTLIQERASKRASGSRFSAIASKFSLPQSIAFARPGRRLWIASLLCVIAIGASIAASSLFFNIECVGYDNDVDKAICNDPQLATADRTLTNLFIFLESRPGPNQQGTLTAEKAAWQEKRNACIKTEIASCLMSKYQAEIGKLKVGPSFECNRDSTPVERAICDDPLLSTKDKKMNDVYESIKNDDVQQKQREWIHQRDQCKGSEMNDCINRLFDRRFIELDRAAKQSRVTIPH
jgi:uncharacterized protein